MTKVDFWCNRCELDQEIYSRPTQNLITIMSDGEIIGHREPEHTKMFFEGRCERCRKTLIRYITDTRQDPYFSLSRNVRRLSVAHKKDLIQYGESGFAMMYPETQKRFEKMREEENSKRVA
ncbi:hypothetical protein LCGC14_1643150, partial [marine sediment metagenome]